ncbi:DUF3397 family protein [Secundilactobacillus oryzae]|uniref:DUF3397 family protein n=1 Tax=Secundilactobacillus oryzae TaxID=1202668 RepID=UPI00054FAA09|nr:DUF3397 family protein [Secundilactobacillus oryzae]
MEHVLENIWVQIAALIVVYGAIVLIRSRIRRWPRRISALDIFTPFILVACVSLMMQLRFLLLWFILGWLIICIIFLLIIGLKNRVLLYRQYFKGIWRLSSLYLLIWYIVGIGVTFI